MAQNENCEIMRKICDLGFKVTGLFRRRYKQAAILTDKSMKQVMEESFELWLRVHNIDI
jgi:hypothetical protein